MTITLSLSGAAFQNRSSSAVISSRGQQSLAAPHRRCLVSWLLAAEETHWLCFTHFCLKQEDATWTETEMYYNGLCNKRLFLGKWLGKYLCHFGITAADIKAYVCHLTFKPFLQYVEQLQQLSEEIWFYIHSGIVICATAALRYALLPVSLLTPTGSLQKTKLTNLTPMMVENELIPFKDLTL